ncbi:entericidin [Limnohabitans sp. TS-CS-82]|jgi:predicted small secreted protein|uniref:Entericidin n=1 Tax=Limnohabitans curvus TaxID=323423 RepID=A0A315ESU5_9BURK|nr:MULTISPECIES: entericidin A/B family lipoprotein [Limnohabitans]PQA79940.1 entericidin [Limnohabitans sp. TS-CS-82]PUE59908.1 entericidin [Limnohabitans curvus]
MNKLLLIALALVAVVGLSACNTMRGIGQDVQKAGTAIEDAAKKK